MVSWAKRTSFVGAVLVALAAVVVQVGAQGQLSAKPDAKPDVWVTTWGASQQIPEPGNALPEDDLRDATVRQIFHVSLGGAKVRVHVSNVFGIEALHFTAVHIARPLSPAGPEIDAATDKALTFAGATDVTVPPGAEFISDAVDFPMAVLSDVAVTYHLDAPPTRETGHPGSRATSYYVHGDFTGAAKLDPSDVDLSLGTPESQHSGKEPSMGGVNPKHVDHWYQVSAIDVMAKAGASAVVALGDSITDGHGTTTNGNDRWTDVLAAELQKNAKTRNVGVSNQGLGGNHLLTDGLGPNALARFDRDVLAPAGARTVIVFEGVNDLGGLARDGEVSQADHAAEVARVLAAYEQMIERAHAHGLRVIGGTITPYVGSTYYHPGPLSEADRQQVNAWIRAAGHFDAVVDFDAVVRDPEHVDRLLPAYDCGDHLHPSPAGYKVMGEAAYGVVREK